MIAGPITWNIRAVIAVYVLRFIIGFFLVRIMGSLVVPVSPLWIDFVDRTVMIVLVWYGVYRSGGDFARLGVSWRQPGKYLVIGAAAGLLLLAASVYSERMYAAMFFQDSSAQHPLVTLVKQASGWRDLWRPLLSAGVTAPVAEELFYRLFTFLPLRQRWGLWGGAVMSAGIFALMHFHVYWLGEMMVVGVGLAMLYFYSGSLFSVIVAHSFINTGKILMIFFAAQTGWK